MQISQLLFLVAVVAGVYFLMTAIAGIYFLRQAKTTVPATTLGPLAPSTSSRPAVLGPVPIGGRFACRELREIAISAAKLIAVAGGPHAPAVVTAKQLSGESVRTLFGLHSDGRVYGLELMQFIFHDASLDLTRHTLVMAEAENGIGNIALLVKPESSSVRLLG